MWKANSCWGSYLSLCNGPSAAGGATGEVERTELVTSQAAASTWVIFWVSHAFPPSLSLTGNETCESSDAHSYIFYPPWGGHIQGVAKHMCFKAGLCTRLGSSGRDCLFFLAQAVQDTFPNLAFLFFPKQGIKSNQPTNKNPPKQT